MAFGCEKCHTALEYRYSILGKDKGETVRMRLEKIQNYMKEKNVTFTYTEEDGLGSIDWVHRGLSYHIWEFPEDGAESNVRATGVTDDYLGDYEEQILAILKENFYH